MEGPERHLITVGASFPMRGRRRARKHLKSPYAGLLRGCRTHDSSPDPTESDVDTTGQSSAPCGTVPCLASCERKHQQPVREEPFRSSGEYSRSVKSQSNCQREDRPHGSLHQDGGVRLRVLDCRPSRNRLAAAASGRLTASRQLTSELRLSPHPIPPWPASSSNRRATDWPEQKLRLPSPANLQKPG